MAYPEPGMMVIATSTFEMYADPDRIPEFYYERNDPLNPPISINIGTRLLVMCVTERAICFVYEGPRLAWASRTAVERNTAHLAAIEDEDHASFIEYSVLMRADPDTIWSQVPLEVVEHLLAANDDLGGSASTSPRGTMEP